MKRCLLVSSFLVLSLACSTPFNSGISGDTPVNSIAGEDESALCTALQTEAEAEGALEAQKKVGCFIAGSLAAAFIMDDTPPEEECQEVYNDCMAEEDDAAEDGEDAAESCDLNFGDCAAPLADFEACTRAGWDEFKKMADEMSCTADEGDTSDADSSCTNPEACKAYYDACPEMNPCTEQFGVLLT